MCHSAEITFNAPTDLGPWGPWDDCETKEYVSSFAVDIMERTDQKIGVGTIKMTCTSGTELTSNSFVNDIGWYDVRSGENSCPGGYSEARGSFQPDQVGIIYSPMSPYKVVKDKMKEI